MKNKQQEYINDIIKSLHIIEENMKHIQTEADFYIETPYSDSCCFRLIHIGELCNKPEIRQLENIYPDVPFKALRGLRNRIAHTYDDIEFDKQIAYETVTENLPELITKFEYIQRDLPTRSISIDDNDQTPKIGGGTNRNFFLFF